MRSSTSKKFATHSTEGETTSTEMIHFVENLKQQWVETIDALPDPFMIVGRDYKIIKANAALAETAEKNIKSVIGETCYKVFANRNSPCENCQMNLVTTGKTLPAYEIHNKQNDRWYEVVSKSLKYHKSLAKMGGHEGDAVLQIYRDRTETMRLQNQLAQQEKLASIGQLAGGFAHEINNPLGGILVFSQMLLRELDPKTSHFQDVKEIENAAQRCKSIVEGMLSFARQRPMKLKLEPTDYHSAIEYATKFAQVGLKSGSQIEFVIDLKATNFNGLSDRNSVIQIILNLCSNAIQAMKNDGGIVHVSTKNILKGKKEYIEIVVSDSGQGIKKENLKKIFDPFFTTKEPGQGTGLGLSIVHGLVQDLSSSISVESKLGKGTKFVLEMPIQSNPNSIGGNQ